MTTSEIEEMASGHFRSGYCCSESVCKTIVEFFDPSAPDDVLKMASGFCGGVGSTHEEACGALTGGILAVGCLYGRNRPDGDHQKAKDLSAEFRKRFQERFGATQCQKLLDKLGDQSDSEKCRSLTGEAAGILFELLHKH